MKRKIKPSAYGRLIPSVRRRHILEYGRHEVISVYEHHWSATLLQSSPYPAATSEHCPMKKSMPPLLAPIFSSFLEFWGFLGSLKIHEQRLDFWLFSKLVLICGLICFSFFSSWDNFPSRYHSKKGTFSPKMARSGLVFARDPPSK